MSLAIPKTVIFVWFGPPMPDWIRRNVAEFERLNPTWTLRVVGEEVLYPAWRKTYNRVTDICTKADLLAMSELRVNGGWYFDCDYWPFRSIDAIVEAYDVDARRMFVTEQHGQKAAELRIANGVMAAMPEWAGWPIVDEAVINAPAEIHRCDFGPTLLTRMYDDAPSLFSVGPWPWFYPAEIGRALDLYPTCLDGTAKKYARRWAPTCGQLPFMMHVWAHGSVDPQNRKRQESKLAALDGDRDGEYAGKRAVLACLDIQWRDTTQPFQAVARGLAAAGFAVDVQKLENGNPPCLDTADLLATWNGRKFAYLTARRHAESFGLPVLVFEHGFLGDRRAHTHIDHQGILQWASWARDWDDPAPDDADVKLAAVLPDGIKETKSSRNGYVLVIGQLDGDSQLDGCEEEHALQLEKMVFRGLPAGVKAVFRPHPESRVAPRHYLPVCEAPTLKDAAAGARFAVMINSNTGNECLAWGCPVLCLGPSLYAHAGAAKQTSVNGMRSALAEMVHGWEPVQSKVDNYLRWLACRQYSQSELESASVMTGVVRRAFE